MNKIYALIVAALFILIPNMTFAASVTFAEGQEYTKFAPEFRNNQDIAQLLAKDLKKTQVLYFFNYGCSVCAKFDPLFQKWASKQQSNKNLVIYKFPVAFKDEWQELAKLYYIMKVLDPKQNLNENIFKAIQDQKLKLWQKDTMQEYFIKNGYSAAAFEQTYNSFGVNREVETAKQLSIAYDIDRTPTIVVNGIHNSYKINSDPNDADFFNILDFVIALDAKA